MKIKRLIANDVHGYIDIDVSFFETLNFLIGINGSGKTSSLRLIMALLVPNISELESIEFSTVVLTLTQNESDIEVKASKTKDGITLEVSNQEEKLFVDSSELEYFTDSKRRDEARSPIQERVMSSNVIKAISQLSTPMFLGLDRKWSVSKYNEDYEEVRRQEYLARRYWLDEQDVRERPVSLSAVNYLVVKKWQGIRLEQEMLDEELRTQFFTKAFEYKPQEALSPISVAAPSSDELKKYKDQLAKIESAAGTSKIPVPAIRDALNHFIEKMTSVVDAIERDKKKRTKSPEKISQNILEWIVNQPQIDKINEHLSFLITYLEKRESLRNPINNFLNLVNDFFVKTNKKIHITKDGQLSVLVGGVLRSITALSSGERQILVMLAHLAFNESLETSGVFIVDEPELSLHIAWQEKFVQAITEANSNVQFILATHSPAIIMENDASCISLDQDLVLLSGE